MTFLDEVMKHVAPDNCRPRMCQFGPGNFRTIPDNIRTIPGQCDPQKCTQMGGRDPRSRRFKVHPGQLSFDVFSWKLFLRTIPDNYYLDTVRVAPGIGHHFPLAPIASLSSLRTEEWPALPKPTSQQWPHPPISVRAPRI